MLVSGYMGGRCVLPPTKLQTLHMHASRLDHELVC